MANSITREQTAKYLYDAGFREPDLSKMVAIAGRESGYQPSAHRTDQDKSKLSGDRGLFQVNYVHDNNLMKAGIINGKADLFDPATAAKAAFYLYQQGGLSPWNAGPGGWRASGDPLYGTDYGAAQTATANFLNSPAANGDAGGAAAGTEVDPTGAQAGVQHMPTRNTEYDPTYETPTIDPQAQKGLTDLLGKFGVQYPNAPRATPQLLAFMRGLGMSYDTLTDKSRMQQSQVEGRSADQMEDLQRADERKRVAITSDLQQRNVLSSGAANTQYARQAEDVAATEADITRNKADSIAEIDMAEREGKDNLRMGASEKIINEETRQATEEATAKERVRDFQARRSEADYQQEREDAAREIAIKQTEDLYKNLGLGVRI